MTDPRIIFIGASETDAAGQMVLRLQTPWRGGTTHLVMSPLEFMQRLAALLPRRTRMAVGVAGELAVPAITSRPTGVVWPIEYVNAALAPTVGSGHAELQS